jgi:non-specific serine/threonine protein kinase
MLLLHAAWSLTRGLILWAEDSARPARAQARRRTTRAAAHPFAAPADEIREALTALGVPGTNGPEPDEALLLLPSATSGPLPSPLLPRDEDDAPTAARSPTWRPWRVPCLVLSAWQTAGICRALLEAPPGPARPGPEVAVFARAALLVDEWVLRGRFLPSLSQVDGTWRAHWRPVLRDAEDRARVALLVAALPPASRAVLEDEAAGWESLPTAATLVHDLLEALTDAAVAEGVEHFEGKLPAAPRGRTSTKLLEHAARAWLAALVSAEEDLDGAKGDLTALAAALEAWTAPWVAAAALRTCFRLSEPPEDAAPAAP